MKKEDKSASGEQTVLSAYRIMAGIALRRAIKRREEKHSDPEMHSRLVGGARGAFPDGRRGRRCIPDWSEAEDFRHYNAAHGAAILQFFFPS